MAGAIRKAFEQDDKRRYGHADGKPAEFQALHLSAFARLQRPDIAHLPRVIAADPRKGTRSVHFLSTGRVSVLKKGAAEPDVFYKAEGYDLDEGDAIVVETGGGGGGYGPPDARADALLLRDLVRGYISLQAAERDYAVTRAADGTFRRNGATLG